MMITDICRHINNFFPYESHEGEFSVVSGVIAADFLESFEYYLIQGSHLNDGVHLNPASDLRDETFTGRILRMKPPLDFLKLVCDIESFEKNQGSSPAFVSESFGGYSYKRAEVNGLPATWQSVFKERLNAFRRLIPDYGDAAV